jgi:hypothetical protein
MMLPLQHKHDTGYCHAEEFIADDEPAVSRAEVAARLTYAGSNVWKQCLTQPTSATGFQVGVCNHTHAALSLS